MKVIKVIFVSIMNVMIAALILVMSAGVAISASSHYSPFVAAIMCISGFVFLTIINVCYINKKHYHDGEKIINEV